jgi:hypothetical protein
MRDNEKEIFGKLLSGVSELYGKKLSEELMEIYWQSLNNYSLNDFSKAIQLHMLNPDNGQFMPKPADILRYLEGRTYDKALKAWTKVISAMKTVGAYESIIFDDPIIHVVITEMGSWIELCHIKNDKLPFIAQEFQKRYCAYLIHPPLHSPRHLSGILEHQNMIQGYFIPEPVLFSEKEKSLLILNFNDEEKTND